MSWISSLSFEELQKFREVVWNIHFRHMPNVPYDPKEADKLIEALGGEVLERRLRDLATKGDLG